MSRRAVGFLVLTMILGPGMLWPGRADAQTLVC